MHRLPTALRIILILKAILNNLKLQLANRTDNLAPVELVDKQLCHTFVHQLVDTFFQLFSLHGVCVLYILEHLGGEAWQSLEVQLLSFGESVAYLEYTIVWQADDVARVGLIDGAFLLCHELCGAGEAYCLAVAHVQVGCIADKLS